MKLKLVQRAAGGLASFFNRYSAANPSFKRGTLPNVPVGPKDDITPYERTAIMAKTRVLEQNSPVMSAILEAFASYGVHTGINPIPMTSDMDFNMRALDYWNEWTRVCCINMRLGFYEIEELIDRRELVDGDIFSLLTFNGNGDPRIQLLEGHRCRSVHGGVGAPNEFDGVIYDGGGRARQYRFFEDKQFGALSAESVLVDTNDIVQHFSPYRVNQLRGVSRFGCVLDEIQDLDELLDSEMQVAKHNANTADVVANEAGEASVDDTKDFFRREVPKGTMTDDEADNELKYYQRTIGPETRYIKRGDKIYRLESNRPSSAWQGYVRHLMRTICAGTGISFDLVWEPSDQGGATCRFQIEKDQRFFDRRFVRRQHEYSRIYSYVIERALINGALTGAPRDWWKHRFAKPRRATVDLGRDTKAMVDGIGIGSVTMHDVHGEAGNDWMQKMREKAENVFYAAKLAKEYSKEGVTISREEILKLDANEISAKASANKQADANAKRQPEKQDDSIDE